jgi:AsmA protein
MKLLKIIFIVLLSLILILGISLWLATKFIKPGWVKPYINKQLTAITGQHSQIKGAIKWDIFPSPGIQVQDIQIGEQPGKDNLYLYIDKLLLKLELKPLIQRQIIFKNIKINGFKAQINANAPSKTPQKSTTKVEPAQPKQPIEKKPANFEFAIDNFALNNGEVIFSNKEQTITLSDMSASLNQFKMDNQFFPIHFQSHINVRAPGHKGKASLKYRGKTKINPALLLAENPAQHIHSEGQLQINDITYDTFTINNIATTLIIKDSLVSLNPLTISLYDGKSVGNASYHLNTQQFNVNQTATNINVGKLINQMVEKHLIDGSLDFIMNSSGSLKGVDWQKSIRAKGNATIKDGKLFFLDVDQLIVDLTKQLKFLTNDNQVNMDIASQLANLNPESYQKGTTAFKLLSLNYDLFNNLQVRNSFILQTNHVALNGEGLIDINAMTINDQLILKIISDSKQLAELQSIFDNGIPLVMKGELAKPLVYPDLRQLTSIISKHLIKKTFNKPINQLKNELKGLFGR